MSQTSDDSFFADGRSNGWPCIKLHLLQIVKILKDTRETRMHSTVTGGYVVLMYKNNAHITVR